MTTPAQAYGHPDFVTDWPVQGPTDPGIRAADCRFAQTQLPAHPACSDCEGPIPMWAQKVSFGGNVLGLAAPGDPDVWTTITPDQQKWVTSTIVALDKKIQAQTKTTCPGMQTGSITGIAGCFQNWFNSAKTGLTKSDGSLVVLRNDGVFDQDTLDALRTVAALSPNDFPTPFPGTTLPERVMPKTGLSTGAIVGIGAVGAGAVGTVIYLMTRKSSKRKSRK